MQRWQYSGSYSWAGSRHGSPPSAHSSPSPPSLSSRLLAFMNCTQGFPCLLASTELTNRGSRRDVEWEEKKEDSPKPGQSSAPLPKLLWESSLGSGNLFFLLPFQAQKWSQFPGCWPRCSTFPCWFSVTLPSPL